MLFKFILSSDCLSVYILTFRSCKKSCLVFCKKTVVKNFTKFTGKHLRWSFFLNKVGGFYHATLSEKRLQYRCFPVKAPIEDLWMTGLNVCKSFKAFVSIRSIRNFCVRKRKSKFKG